MEAFTADCDGNCKSKNIKVYENATAVKQEVNPHGNQVCTVDKNLEAVKNRI